MPNALATGNGNALRPEDAPMGYGLAKAAGNIKTLHKKWQELFTSGDTSMQFREWLDSQGINNPVMPR